MDGTPLDAPTSSSKAPAPPPSHGAEEVDGEPLGGSGEGEATLPKEVRRELEVKLVEFTDGLDSLGKSSECKLTAENATTR